MEPWLWDGCMGAWVYGGMGVRGLGLGWVGVLALGWVHGCMGVWGLGLGWVGALALGCVCFGCVDKAA